MPDIEYIVLAGAGPNGLGQLGILDVLHDKQFFNMKTVKKIFGTSAGAILACTLALGINTKEMIEYIIERPWNKMIKIDLESFLSWNLNKGLISNELIREAIVPFFKAYDLDTEMTLLDAYNLTGIELNLMTVELATFTDLTLNYSTFPDLPILKAVCMSSACPPIFTPVEYKGKYYVDGGLLNNYPLDNITHTLDPKMYDRILSIRILKKPEIVVKEVKIQELSGLEYAQYIIQKSFGVLGNGNEFRNGDSRRIPYEVICEVDYYITDSKLWKEFTRSRQSKVDIYNNGIVSANKFLENIKWKGNATADDATADDATADDATADDATADGAAADYVISGDSAANDTEDNRCAHILDDDETDWRLTAAQQAGNATIN